MRGWVNTPPPLLGDKDRGSREEQREATKTSSAWAAGEDGPGQCWAHIVNTNNNAVNTNDNAVTTNDNAVTTNDNAVNTNNNVVNREQQKLKGFRTKSKTVT